MAIATAVLSLLRSMHWISVREFTQVLGTTDSQIYRAIMILRQKGFDIVARREWPFNEHKKQPMMVKYYSLREE